ncbi:MAG: deoxyribonuclease IV [Coriobacteriia bacterium]
MLIGAHIGVSGGYPEALEYSVSVGCEAVQVFAKSPRQWQAPSTSEDVAALFRSTRTSLGIAYVCTHTAYLINLGSDDDAIWERSWRALADELRRAALLGADATVTHIGTNRSGDVDRAADRVAKAVSHALKDADVPVTLLLENTAGAGTTFGATSWEIGAVLARSDDVHGDRVGVCLDTCHAHAAGYDLSVPGAWGALLDEFDLHCGPGRIQLVHANDCAYPPGTHKDRHAWIGDGTIGEEGFAGMFLEPRLAGGVAIIEMPGEVPVKDEENVRRLKALREACGEHDYNA